MSFLPYLHRVAARENLSAADADEAMSLVLGGGASTAQIASFLVALRMKGETAEELLGFARAMRRAAIPVDCEKPVLDTCGTGGDGLGTFNISTVVAFVVAGAGIRIAKHGNRSISSQCGSADVLEKLGIPVMHDPAQMARAIHEAGIGFLFAPALHPAMKHAQPARLELKMRTVFNLLGPLTNPAGANAQLVGAPSEHAAQLMAEALAALGLEHGFVVHGSDGLDEITTTGPTLAFEIATGKALTRTLTPEDFGVARAQLSDLMGGDAQANSEIASAILSGALGPKRDIVLVNAAAALVAGGRSATFLEGVRIAAESIDSGAARSKLEQLRRLARGSSE